MSNSTDLTGLLPEPHGGATLLSNPDVLCTLATCDLTLAHLKYLPSLAGNAFYAAIFAGCLIFQLVLGIRYRTWGFMTAAILGMLTEIIGYIARIAVHSNPFIKTNFLMYLVTLTIAPAFLSAAIYLCLARIVVVYGEERSRFRPVTYTLVFCTGDFLALLLQAVGGAIASGAASASTTQMGINIMLAGLSYQVASLLMFSFCCVEFALRVYAFSRTPGHPYSSNSTNGPNSPSSIRTGQPLNSSLPKSILFRSFLAGLCIATVTIFIRSVFRVAELSGGFHGPLANNQVSFMILEGAMVCIACLCLTIMHPGLCFQGEWRAANFTLRRKMLNSNGKDVFLSDLDTQSVEPPHYSESGDDMDSLNSGPLDARVMTATYFRPGEAHLELVSIYGIRYENTSDEYPRPRSG
ncbi:RTA1-domain-containing protein [Hyaloscypha variabilis F]|uniref:RTA1-domain-containing protein n=1 Tax=Hyaloscypha variabilis (strain UAMH 11265 / GT02V1 / F) TaxID=1149755 RepID=A0A2J6SD28_HYAVF|nr:RTA1-domain-containing protein [Hyaloscypha variabilis F]